jgi:hypothetical protein
MSPVPNPSIPPLATIVIAAVREDASGDDLRLTTFLYVMKEPLV